MNGVFHEMFEKTLLRFLTPSSKFSGLKLTVVPIKLPRGTRGKSYIIIWHTINVVMMALLFSWRWHPCQKIICEWWCNVWLTSFSIHIDDMAPGVVFIQGVAPDVSHLKNVNTLIINFQQRTARWAMWYS